MEATHPSTDFPWAAKHTGTELPNCSSILHNRNVNSKLVGIGTGSCHYKPELQNFIQGMLSGSIELNVALVSILFTVYRHLVNGAE